MTDQTARNHQTSSGEWRASTSQSEDIAKPPKQETNKPISKTRGDHFLPVTRFAIYYHILQEGLSNGSDDSNDDGTLKELLDYMAAWRHQTHRDRLLRLLELYLPFSPDRDTVRVLQYSQDEREAMLAELMSHIKWLLERGNYKRITEAQLNDLLSRHSPHGLELKVDLNEYDELLLFSRGEDFEEYVTRSPWTLYLKRQVHQVPLFKRLFLLMKIKPEEERIKELMEQHGISRRKAARRVRKSRKFLGGAVSPDYVYLKMFKDIPQEDLEMMFPNTQVKFKLWDKIKLSLTAGGGTVGSILSTAGGSGKLVTALGSSLSTAGIASMAPMALASAFAGLAAVVYRQVTQFFSQRTKYMMELAQRLYFHSLADNRGAIALLSDRAEAEDVKEDMLLYFLLHQNPTPFSELEKLDQKIEQFLRDSFGVEADFEIDDAVRRLLEDGLIIRGEDGNLQALPPAEALAHLKRALSTAILGSAPNGASPLQDVQTQGPEA